ncbi:MAG: carbohydrate ABC transporter permease [Chloroflexota bacterium]|nr:carbohydrate ABC transporter permease [Chloroflexota bacterium]
MTSQRTFKRTLLRLLTIYLPALIVLVLILFPFYWMVVTSFKADSELTNLKINPFYPHTPTWAHYYRLLWQTAYIRWFWNTTYVAICSTVISMVISILAGYALARLRFPGSSLFSGAIFVVYLVPTTLLFIPMTQVIQRFGLINNPLALIIVYPTFLVPFCTWLLIGYFQTIPRELDECAMVDGATRFQALLRIVLPSAIPGVVTAGIFAFTLSWNEFIYSLVLVSTDNSRTLAVGVLTKLVRGDLLPWGPLMASALIGSIPVAILYSFFVEQYVSGLTAGAVKG